MNAISLSAAPTLVTPAANPAAPAADAAGAAEAPGSFARLLGQARTEPGAAAEGRDDAVADRPQRGARGSRLAAAAMPGAAREAAALARGAQRLGAPPEPEADPDETGPTAEADATEAADAAPLATLPTTAAHTPGDGQAAARLSPWHAFVQPQPAPAPAAAAATVPADEPATAAPTPPATRAPVFEGPAAAVLQAPNAGPGQGARPARAPAAAADEAEAAIDAGAVARPVVPQQPRDAARPAAPDTPRDASRPASRVPAAADTPAGPAAPAATAEHTATPVRSFAAELQAVLPAAPQSAATAAPELAQQASVATAAAEGRITSRPDSAEFAPELGARITTFVRDGVQHARLELNPAALGPVSVQIQLDGQAAQVHLAAAQPETRAALEQAMPQLAGSLRDAGLTLAGGGVFDQPRQPQGDAGAGEANRASRNDQGLRDEASAAQTIAAPRRRGVVDLVA